MIDLPLLTTELVSQQSSAPSSGILIPLRKKLNLKIFHPPHEGIHRWIYSTACFLRDQGMLQTSALQGIKRICAETKMRRSVPDREIESAVASAYGNPRNQGFRKVASTAIQNGQHNSETARSLLSNATFSEKGWPKEMACPQSKLNKAEQERIIQTGFTLADLRNASPVRLNGRPPQTLNILKALYQREELLCLGRSSTQFDTLPLKRWAISPALSRLSLIVPNPMSAVFGLTGSGKLSKHCRANTGSRRFIIIEFDDIESIDAQASILWHLRTRTNAPLVLVVMSGGKSIHGWFHCENIPENQLRGWFGNQAVALGADPRLWLPEQFCRLPDGTRNNGNRQSTIYFNPDAIK